MNQFAARHIGLGPDTLAAVRQELGLDPDRPLLEQALPPALQSPVPPLGPALTEAEASDQLRQLAALNQPGRSMIGLGYYRSLVPAVIQRCVLENPSWYTAYTPYQAEISQGRLEALLVFQTMVADLTGLPVANASLLDEATAAAEAMTLCHRVGRGKKTRLAVDVDVFPQVKAVLETRAEPLGIELVWFDPLRPDPSKMTAAAGLYVQYQGASGRAVNLAPLAQLAHQAGALLAVAADPLMLTLFQPPGEVGADICVGSTQRFGQPLGFGGPHAAYMAVRQDFVRQMPGRLVGQSVDSAGAPALRLALVTREQHIRRDKATSNICTAQVLMAVMAAMYAAWHGPDGLARIAGRIHSQALALRQVLDGVDGLAPRPGPLFDTVAVDCPGQAASIVRAARGRGLHLWQQDGDTVYFSTDEATTGEDIRHLVAAFGGDAAAQTRATQLADADPIVPAASSGSQPSGQADVTGGDAGELGESCVGGPAPRRTPFLTHGVFSQHRTELAMMRYLKSLADRDYAMDRGMIPLGSCTMKLNAASEMAALSWPGFGDLHPFVPRDCARGTLELIRQLGDYLLELTGYEALSVQPNAGSQGELAGLLAIRRYHQAAGEPGRDICLIPVSAHGTNAASAALAGYQVVGVDVDQDGDVSLEDLRAKLEQHAGRVGALMITYPSTHGVYEASVQTVCDLAHQAGAQVYIDGANFNALTGWAKAGQFGGDVSHLNLHKTFAMPHGGGGPGVGPVAVRAHLAPFLPGHPLGGLATRGGAVSAAPYGSPLLLAISWTYIKLMGGAGLRQASDVAVTAANYVAHRLRHALPVVYRGPGGFVAHECLLDLRGLTARSGLTAEDVAKRLMDYGFHAPTMSFPVAGSLMVEPTESESLAELDRFCDAMLAIVAEADRVVAGEWLLAESPARLAPHTALAVTGDAWARPYSRQLGAYPAGLNASKYWPPVGRVDAAYGDRHLVPVLTERPPT